ncbi:MAG TPA: rhodanese-like domain-containing protein [Actinomycetota bacterium]|nr:rhodanese-like domain-containing protein [Actinomycetota bacterium]
MKKSATDLVAEAKREVQNLTPDQVAQELEEGALLVDVREPEERAAASIPRAIAAPRGMLEFYADPDLPYHKPEFTHDRRIILHCASGGRSALAAATLQRMGYENVAHLDGGIKAWQEAGRTTEPGA